MSDHEYSPDSNPIDPLWKEFNETGRQAGGLEQTDGEADLDEIFRDYTYLCRLNLIDSDGMLAWSLSTIDVIKKKYGAENVIVSAVSVDPDSQEKVAESNGSVGVWVKSDAKSRDYPLTSRNRSATLVV